MKGGISPSRKFLTIGTNKLRETSVNFTPSCVNLGVCLRGEMHPLLRLLVMKSAGNLESALRDRADTVYPGLLLLAKTGRYPRLDGTRSLKCHSIAPVIIVTKGWILGVPDFTLECVALVG